ncbi:DHH family phosphoesterase [Patescibacteria group bacterium]|nr:DHH family phosphoesterase [Patescibacteria group bacterium]MBU1721697.1 DHH family phosphoesterase [Patescibacteria group bacterium]MBU1901450.1 DHH family phosphoesterase [Patescibacteria group bacterium]
MALGIIDQIKQQTDKAHHVLITCKKDADSDAIASAIAFSSFLVQSGKKVDIVIDNFVLPHKLTFLQNTKKISATFPHLQQFMLTIDVAESGVQELSYDIKEKKLHIFITPKSGFLTKDHIHTAQSAFRYDSIIVLGAQDLRSLGNVYAKHKQLFQEVPIINIDSHPANEHFGQINMVEITASSTAEIITTYIKQVNKTAIDKAMATALMTGMIAATNSFKTDHIKPKTLSLASELVSMGANREDIIKHLYQTKSLALLRLWGQALAHMNYDETIGLISTSITRDDIMRSGAKSDDIIDIIDELISNAPEEKIAVVLYEGIKKEEPIRGILHTEKGIDAKKLLKKYKTTGTSNLIQFSMEQKNILEAEKYIISEIKKQL